MDIRGVAGAADAASRGAGALPRPATPEYVDEQTMSVVVEPKRHEVVASTAPIRQTAPPQDVDLSLYEPLASAGTKSAGKAVMLILAALAGLLVIGFGVVTFASSLPGTIAELFH